jgi:hypothetical protein
MSVMTRPACIIVVALLTVGLFQATAAAQQRYALFGMVQWASGNRVQMMADNGMSVSIDVSRLDQSAYTSLRGGERIRVVGYTSPDRTRVIAESLEIGDASSGFWTFPQTS